jgi:hypothetical protein
MSDSDKGEAGELIELICHASPVAWIFNQDYEGAKKWEKQVAILLAARRSSAEPSGDELGDDTIETMADEWISHYTWESEPDIDQIHAHLCELIRKTSRLAARRPEPRHAD